MFLVQWLGLLCYVLLLRFWGQCCGMLRAKVLTYNIIKLNGIKGLEAKKWVML